MSCVILALAMVGQCAGGQCSSGATFAPSPSMQFTAEYPLFLEPIPSVQAPVIYHYDAPRPYRVVRRYYVSPPVYHGGFPGPFHSFAPRCSGGSCR